MRIHKRALLLVWLLALAVSGVASLAFADSPTVAANTIENLNIVIYQGETANSGHEVSRAAFGQSFTLAKGQYFDIDRGRAAIRIVDFREGYRIDEVVVTITVASRKPFNKRMSARSSPVRFRYTDDEQYEIKVLGVNLQEKKAIVNVRRV